MERGDGAAPGADKRQFVRHTVDVPLEVSAVPSAHISPNGVNVGYGGLAFTLDECLDVDQVIHLRIPTVNPPFEADARVAWCRREGDRYLVGVAFLDSGAAFQSRMVEQVCAIESYRTHVKREEGRVLSTPEAAAEWIEKFAGRFPG